MTPSGWVSERGGDDPACFDDTRTCSRAQRGGKEPERLQLAEVLAVVEHEHREPNSDRVGDLAQAPGSDAALFIWE